MFSHKRIATQYSCNARISLAEDQVQREDFFATRQLLGFFVENLSNTREERVFNKIDQRLVHTCF